MIEIKGSIWDYLGKENHYIAITTNGIVTSNGLVMGKGIALEAKLRYPGIEKQLGAHIKENGNTPCILYSKKLISFPTKHHWRDKSDLELIVESAQFIKTYVDKTGWTVVSPRPGCGNGGLIWENVRESLLFLSDNFIFVG